MKYIIFERKYDGLKYGITFPEFITHKDMADKITDKPVSAGFIDFNSDSKPSTYGKSISLGLEAWNDDSDYFKD